jgi:hypothetical protein
MPWYAWAMIGWILVGSILTVILVDKPREPISGYVAVLILIVQALYVWGIVSLAT